MKRKPSPPGAELVFARWQHLEFFQWFSREFKAVRMNEKNNEGTVKITPHGIGMSYSKNHGVDIIHRPSARQLSSGRRAMPYWQTVHTRRTITTNYGYCTEISNAIKHPSLADRLAFWRNNRPEFTDLRQATMYAAILAYQPNTIHPSRR